MSKEIKCPICQGVSTLRYNENRTYMSHCHDINCFKLVTVTAPSEAVAEELFSKFEKGTIQSKLSIPKKIAEELEELTGKTNWESTPYSVIEEKGKINTWAYLGHGKCSEQLYKFCRDNTRLMHAYLNPLTRPFVEVTDE